MNQQLYMTVHVHVYIYGKQIRNKIKNKLMMVIIIIIIINNIELNRIQLNLSVISDWNKFQKKNLNNNNNAFKFVICKFHYYLFV